jgi:hypothetical protein
MTALPWLKSGGDAIGPDDRDSSRFEQEGRIERLLAWLRPEDGFASLPLVLVLTATMAWSIADARWILGENGLTSFLVWVAMAAALWGYVSARLDLPPWLAQGLGCLVGAFVLIEAVGASLPGAEPSLVGWFQAAASSFAQAYLDLTWRHQVSTVQTAHFSILLGVLVWGTAQAASYDVFGYHRSVNGVLLLAVVLIANMALTPNDQYLDLVIFSAAALVLLLLAHAADERSSWLRHRIWRGRDFQAPHLQGGLTFASIAVAGSLILTMFASSAPLRPMVQNLSGDLQNAFGGFSGLLPNGGASRVPANSDFGTTAPISDLFHESTHNVFTVRVPNATTSFHWRMVAYDTFQTTGWSVGAGARQDQVVAGDQLERGTNDLVGLATPGRRPVSITVHIQDTSISHLIAANEPGSVNAGVERTLIGDDGSLNVAGLSTKSTDYVVSSYVPDTSQDGTGLTEWRLQHAGKTYPPGLLARYTQGAALVGSAGRALLTEIRTWTTKNGSTLDVAFNNEYDVAKAIQTYLRSDAFTYNTDISGLIGKCTGVSTADCFALIRQGFCEQYATTMTMLMRMAGYPARYVLGYLPGPVDPRQLVGQVTNQQKHAWVEVFFPTYGWITFDPTGGGIGDPTVLVRGSAVVATPTPSAPIAPDDSNPVASDSPSPAPAAGSSTGGGLAPSPLLVTGTLSVAIGLALFLLWRRRLRRLEEPDTVYRNVVRLASRLGYKPQPAQTVYEYTGMLAEIVPQARKSLAVVAMATVEVTYGKRQLGTDRLASLAAAQHTVRQALLGLALRMPRLFGRGKAPISPAGRSDGSRRTRR